MMKRYFVLPFLIIGCWISPLWSQSMETLYMSAANDFELLLKAPPQIYLTPNNIPQSQDIPPYTGITETDIAIPSHGGWTLKGKLAMPATEQARNAVILLHGSGPNDMDLSMPGSITSTGKPSKLFKDLSDTLADAGFLVLRYNKRGVQGWDAATQQPQANNTVYGQITVDDLVQDAVSAVRFLRNYPQPVERIILLGISEGSCLAPLVAERESVDGLILLSAMARRLDELVRYQLIERELGWARDYLDADRNDEITKSEAARYSEMTVSEHFAEFDEDHDDILSYNEVRAALESVFQKFEQSLNKSPWYRSHLQLNPTQNIIAAYHGPILIMQGELDQQTPLTEARTLEHVLQVSGHPDHTLKTFPGLGHGFSPPQDGWKPRVGPIDQSVLIWLAGWARNKFQ